MNRLLIVLIFLSVASNIYADNNEQQIREKIACINNVYVKNPKKDSLLKVISYYEQLDSILIAHIAEKDSILQKFEPYKDVLFVLSGDTSVFYIDYPQKVNIPTALVQQYEMLERITAIRKRLEEINNKVRQLSPKGSESLYLTPEDIIKYKSLVRSAIEEDMEKLSDLLFQIKEYDLTNRLSVPQYDFFKGLVNQYNQFVKIFEK